VGLDPADDAGVFQLTEDILLVQTADFITPVVDDPFDYGRIAAANSLSDVYAMGGRPLTCLNLVCMDTCNLTEQDLRAILEGALSAIHEADARLVGGHTIEAPEMKFGLSVTGVVEPGHLTPNAGARPGDQLILTKPLGLGIITTAAKADLAPPAAIREATDIMAALNRTAAELMVKADAHAATDITGFGLTGHALEMARASAVTLRFDSASIPVLPSVPELIGMGLVPGGTYRNRAHVSPHMQLSPAITDDNALVLHDAQTSGGLLIALPPEQARDLLKQLQDHGNHHAAIVGEVTECQTYSLIFE